MDPFKLKIYFFNMSFFWLKNKTKQNETLKIDKISC